MFKTNLSGCLILEFGQIEYEFGFLGAFIQIERGEVSIKGVSSTKIDN
jgi:hypothetical protein